MGFSRWILARCGFVKTCDEGDVIADMVEVENARAETVFEVGAQVCYLVGKVDELGLERRELFQEVFGEFRIALRRIIAGVLDDAFTDTKGKIESAKGRIALFEARDDAKGMEIVIEGQMMDTKGLVESVFAGVAKWRMTDVMDERESLGEGRVEAECGGCGTGDLGYFKGVGKAASRVIALCAPSGEYLGLARKTTKGLGMEDAPNVANERSSVWMVGFVKCAVREFAGRKIRYGNRFKFCGRRKCGIEFFHGLSQ